MELINEIASQENIFTVLFLIVFIYQIVENKKIESRLLEQIQEGYKREEELIKSNYELTYIIRDKLSKLEV